jgi:hypothetical protein
MSIGLGVTCDVESGMGIGLPGVMEHIERCELGWPFPCTITSNTIQTSVFYSSLSSRLYAVLCMSFNELPIMSKLPECSSLTHYPCHLHQ